MLLTLFDLEDEWHFVHLDVDCRSHCDDIQIRPRHLWRKYYSRKYPGSELLEGGRLNAFLILILTRI